MKNIALILGRQNIPHGARIPRFHRIAYRDIAMQWAVCFPIGLHFIVRFFRRVWEWSHRYRPSDFEKRLAEVRLEVMREWTSRLADLARERLDSE